MRESDQILFNDLTDAGLHDLARRAARGEWNDYFGFHDLPQLALIEELKAWPQIAASVRKQLIQNVKEGKYDGTTAESNEWAKSPEGQETFGAFGIRPVP